MTVTKFGFEFDNSFARQMEGFYAPAKGAKAPDPKLVLFNTALAESLNLNTKALDTAEGAAIFSGSLFPPNAAPLAQAYAGHQFGGFSPQLGDGRALLLGEIIDTNGHRKDIQLKGSGRTPFSRGGDGKAALGPVLREYIMGEAMHGLGIATTRALAAVTTGEQIERDGPKAGAVLTRVAASHLRVGSFQYFAARKETDQVKRLADYAITRHYSNLENAPDKYTAFLKQVINRQLMLVADWVLAGFVHGVMNTDNMTISGETIDYGPCAFIEHYDPKAVFSSIDQNGRYAYGKQPVMAQWNLARFAETLLPLIEGENIDQAVEIATGIINDIPEQYSAIWLAGMREKLGLSGDPAKDTELVNSILSSLEGQQVDYTLFFRYLADALRGNDAGLIGLFNSEEMVLNWLAEWKTRVAANGDTLEAIATKMDAINPIYIARNHTVERVLAAAEDGEIAPLNELLKALQNPFQAQEGFEKFALPAPDDFGPFQTFCGT